MSRGEHIGDMLLRLFAALVAVLALLPLLTIAVFSFNDFPYYSFPLKGLTLHWYSDVFSDEATRSALKTTLVTAISVAVLSTVLGTSFAMGISRVSGKRMKVLLGIGLLPLVTPALVIAIGSQLLFVESGIRLSEFTAILAQVTAITPFVILLVAGRLASYDWRLTAAARDLGAGAGQAFFHVTLPSIWPAVRAGFLVSLLISFNEFVLTFFAGQGVETITVYLYSLKRFGIEPSMLAYSTVIITFATVVVLATRSTLIAVARKRGDGND